MAEVQIMPLLASVHSDGVSTVHLVAVCPAASVCRRPQDLCSSVCGRRWPAASPQSSHTVGPGGTGGCV